MERSARCAQGAFLRTVAKNFGENAYIVLVAPAPPKESLLLQNFLLHTKKAKFMCLYALRST